MPPALVLAASRLQHDVGALRVKAEAIDDALVGLQAEDPRARVARLWPRRDGADFGKAEAQAQQDVRHLGILVEPGRHADRIGKVEPESPHRQPLVVASDADRRREFQQPQRERVGIFRFERMEERPHQPLERADHEPSSGTGRRPSISSASGRAQRTAESGSGP